MTLLLVLWEEFNFLYWIFKQKGQKFFFFFFSTNTGHEGRQVVKAFLPREQQRLIRIVPGLQEKLTGNHQKHISVFYSHLNTLTSLKWFRTGTLRTVNDCHCVLWHLLSWFAHYELGFILDLCSCLIYLHFSWSFVLSLSHSIFLLVQLSPVSPLSHSQVSYP